MSPQIIGYTTGVFDMFHIGHLNLLKRAREQCDYLIVGVSTDELVASYKGKEPIIPFEQRITIVEAIKYVDQAVPQFCLDKVDAWKTYQFNVMFHGSDWENKPVYQEIVLKLSNVGVKTVFLPYTKNISSSILREKTNLNSKAPETIPKFV